MPTILAFAYIGFVASNQYVSEAQFIVRTASKPAGGAGLGALLQMTGLGRAQDDIFAVQSFFNSRDAAHLLLDKLSLRDMYGRDGVDPLTRYPSLFFGNTVEELHNYLNWMVLTTYSSSTGITTLRVHAFEPSDARDIAATLLDLGEKKVNRLNSRIHTEANRTAQREVKRYQGELIAAQVALTEFRNAELMIDAGGSAIVVSELVATLSAELTQIETQTRAIEIGSPNSPQLSQLKGRANALRKQISAERARISNSSDGLARKLAVYERLVLDREFSKQSLAAAVTSLQSAQQEARRQQLYLERIVEPVVADYPIAPERMRLIATAFGINTILLLVGWLVFSGVREHALQKG